MSDIKFSVVVEQWIFNIFLNDECSKTAIFVSLPTFYSQPDIFKFMIYIYTFTLITTFSRFYDPNIILILDISLFLLLLVYLLKSFPFWVVCGPTYMESQRKYGKNIFVLSWIEIFHEIKECFFIAKITIFNKMIMNFVALWILYFCYSFEWGKCWSFLECFLSDNFFALLIIFIIKAPVFKIPSIEYLFFKSLLQLIWNVIVWIIFPKLFIFF